MRACLRGKVLVAAMSAALVSAALATPGSALARSAPPGVSGVSPASGPTAGGHRVTVSGSGFTHVTAVRFGVVAGRSIRVVSAHKLTVIAPAHVAARIDVRVASTHGTSPTSAKDRYRYVAPPSVATVAPALGPTSGGTRVVVTGANFVRVTRVLFGTALGNAVTVVSAHRLVVTAPVHAAATVHVVVRTAYGASRATMHDHYVYTPFTDAALPLPKGARGYGNLDTDAISCGGPGHCAMVGDYLDTDLDGQGVLWRLTGTRWLGVRAPLPADVSDNPSVSAQGISCAPGGTCVAWGQYEAHTSGADTMTALLWTLSNGAWSVARAPAPANASIKTTSVRVVSCGGAGVCTAYGAADTGPVFWRLGGRAWSVSAPDLPDNALPQRVYDIWSVACGPTGACAGVGGYAAATTGAPVYRGVLWRLSGTAWLPTQAPVPADFAHFGQPVSGAFEVYCASAGQCLVQGVYNVASGRSVGVLWTLSGSSWLLVTLPLPAGKGDPAQATVLALSCGGAGKCAAAGSYIDSAGDTRGVLWALRSGTWVATRAALPADAAANPQVVMTDVSCDATAECTAQGRYTYHAGGADQSNTSLLWTLYRGAWHASKLPWSTTFRYQSPATCVPTMCVSQNYRAKVWRLNQGRWVGYALPLPGNAATPNANAAVSTISCGPAGGCAAAGSYNGNVSTGSATRPVVWTYLG